MSSLVTLTWWLPEKRGRGGEPFPVCPCLYSESACYVTSCLDHKTSLYYISQNPPQLLVPPILLLYWPTVLYSTTNKINIHRRTSPIILPPDYSLWMAGKRVHLQLVLPKQSCMRFLFTGQWVPSALDPWGSVLALSCLSMSWANNFPFLFL